jgi:histidinol-phosphate aminotransferase
MIEDLIRPHIKSFQPYRSARSEVHQASIYLDANELSYGSPLAFDGIALNRYPDPLQSALRTTLAGIMGVPQEMIFTGVGSDEIIDLLVRLFCEPSKDNVVILEPTYGVYRVAAELSAVNAVGVELDENFQIDVEKTFKAIDPNTKILFCCSPNNPTGNLLGTIDIAKICQKFRGIVVVDEAYAEFSQPEPRDQPINLVGRFENLVILKTLSKAWGLAAIRLGYCIAHPTIISYLLRIKSPYNINAVTAHLALSALGQPGFLKQSVRSVIIERNRLRNELGMNPAVLRVFPSDANFFLVEFRDSEKAFELLYKRGIVVRRRSEERLRNCLRITVGTPEENALVVETLGGMA